MFSCRKSHNPNHKIQTTGKPQIKRGQAAVYKHKLVEFCIEALWTDETKSNFNQNDGRNSSRPKAITSSVKHGGGFIMVPACTILELARWHLLMISLLRKQRDECRGAECVLRFSQMCQKSLDDISSFSRTAI